MPPEAAKATTKLDAAAEEIAQVAARKENLSSYTALQVSAAEKRITVYRVPGNARFDQAIARVARKHHVQLELVDSKNSRQRLNAVSETVASRRKMLDREGAPLVATSIDPHGFVIVAVASNVQRARELLADVKRYIRVHRGSAGALLG